MTLPEIRSAIATVLQHTRDAEARNAQMQEDLQRSAGTMYARYERVSTHGAIIATETARGIASPPGDMQAVQIELDALNDRARVLLDTRDDWAAQFVRTMTTLARHHEGLLAMEAAAVFAAGISNQLKVPNGHE